ncbi:hypothetical protein CVT24_002755 [Panaeolus cyanescens]|uniref:Fork-head domain-containing protein n=1 Tax=Panaeolus cyanescens TaxID=181874 RepID=A0A409VN88_9AGAR|nr:hypothetical protein CVT24_002755 [Panaeolus cyanescens]
MNDPHVSPISQLLHTLGITREDLSKNVEQMRQFLTTDDAISARVPERDSVLRQRSASDLLSSSRSTASSRSLARSHSRASSSSMRDLSPPHTPVKSEPNEAEIPHRRMDSMEMVLERQRRQRKSRKEKERERESMRSLPHPPSPSPSNASHSSRRLSSASRSRADSRASSSKPSEASSAANPEAKQSLPPVTPQNSSRYYREHTKLSSGSATRTDLTCKTETPTPTRPPAPPAIHAGQPLTTYFAYPSYVGYTPYLPVTYRTTHPAMAGLSSNPSTPQTQRTQQASDFKANTPLPPSSPPPASSPISSPVRPVNLVSSPGPMGPAPQETEYDNLPYTLPPGPYSTTKPDLSYAALVGRAILSSPEHRLTLQEIYDWITIVFPYYKRGETTWMNSIRHVLSTTVCFRKVPRDRSVGRTLWAIYEEDLECFKGGGFKKQLCKDYMNGNDGKDKSAGAKAKTKTRKRSDDEEPAEGRKAKRARKETSAAGSDGRVIQTSFMPPSTSRGSHPLFPPTRPTPQHQPYYQSCLPQPQTFPSEVIFPPLPAAAAFNRVVNKSLSSMSVSTEDSTKSIESSPPSATESIAPSSSSSLSSLPELTPNRGSSSSPPSSMPATSEADIDMLDEKDISQDDSVAVAQSEEDDPSLEGDDDGIFNTALLGPVRFWGRSPNPSEGLQPGVDIVGIEIDRIFPQDKGKQPMRGSQKHGIPESPTLTRRSSGDADRSSTPPPLIPPSTPPRHAQHKISSIRTPISHKGIHMSPTASLAHYKNNLDPPPVFSGGIAPLEVQDPTEEDADPMRTPRRRSGLNTLLGPPITPRKLLFSSNGIDSPFRTPGRGLFDPHSSLLDEELSRSYDESPGGLFGKNRSSLLYDSPGLDLGSSKWW